MGKRDAFLLGKLDADDWFPVGAEFKRWSNLKYGG